jgi:hypothetical protein
MIRLLPSILAALAAGASDGFGARDAAPIVAKLVRESPAKWPKISLLSEIGAEPWMIRDWRELNRARNRNTSRMR